jgi:predicted dithiol-disulfide oxidoreductase (DUF899 family)
VSYNFDLVEFPSEEAAGFSVFYKNPSGEIFQTYSTYARGVEMVHGTYHLLTSYPRAGTRSVRRNQQSW